jgi:hypothetical protein
MKTAFTFNDELRDQRWIAALGIITLVTGAIGIGFAALAIIRAADGRRETVHRCNAAGGIAQQTIGAPLQCVREGKPVPDSLWRSR